MYMKNYYQDHKEEWKLRAKAISGGVGEAYLLLNKREVKAAANYTCTHCKKVYRDNRLGVHHVIPFELLDGRNDEKDNLLVLCNGCHQALHHLIKDKDIDEVLRITDGYLRHEILSVKEQKEAKIAFVKERQLKIKNLRVLLQQKKVERKAAWDELYAAKQLRKQSHDNIASYRAATAKVQEKQDVVNKLKSECDKMSEELKQLLAEKHCK